MSKKTKKLDVNEFWKDCLEEEKVSKKKNPSLNLNHLSYFHPKTKRNKKLYTHNMKPSYTNSKLIQEAINSEENTKAESNKLLHDSIEYMVSLYNRGMKSKEKKKKNILLIKEKNLNNEKQLCSFKPKQYSNIKLQNKIKKHFGTLTIYERSVEFKQKRMEKMAKLFEENNKKNNVVFSFRPDITNKDLNKVFYSNNIFKEQADNDSNKIFLSRLMKAREEQQYKKNFYKNKTNKKFNCLGNNKVLKKSLSQKDSLLYKNNLHNYILNLKCFHSNNENGKDKNDDFFLN